MPKSKFRPQMFRHEKIVLPRFENSMGTYNVSLHTLRFVTVPLNNKQVQTDEGKKNL